MNNITNFKHIVLLTALVALTACSGGGGGGGDAVPQTIPIIPTSTIASTLSESGVRVTWIDNSDNEDGFLIERSLDPTLGFSEINDTPVDANMYDDNGLNNSTTYYYRVRSYNAAGNSNFSNVASTTTNQAPNSPPASPTNLLGSVISSSTIQLTWTDNATNEANYAVMHADFMGSCGTFSQIDLLSPDTTAYIHSSLAAASLHCYRVEARNDFGTGLSNVVSDILTLSTFTLTASKFGNGTVTATPGINCGSDCNEVYDAGTSVSLQAAATTGSVFVGWSGCDAIKNLRTCVVNMNANRTVTATFENIGF